MPKVTLSYNLPEEREEFNLANRGADYHRILWELDSILRGKVKHGSDEDGAKHQEFRDMLHKLFDEYEVTL